MCIEFNIFVYKIYSVRTNIDIDEKLMEQALKYSKGKTKKEIVNTALNEHVKYLMRLNLLSLEGKVKWIGNLDKMRKNG